MKKKIIVSAIGAIAAMSVYALQAPKALESDKHIQQVSYQENNVVPIYGQTFINTQVLFNKSEQITDIQIGDLDAWTLDHKLNMLFIKPTVLGSHTNLTILTDQHTYYFELTSPDKKEETVSSTPYSIQFVYPKDKRVHGAKEAEPSVFEMALAHPEQFNWAYTQSGNKNALPIQAFDDGKFTYFKFSSHQSLPSIFAVHDPKGEEAVVNVRRKGEWIIVQETAPQFTLRLDSHRAASVFNETLIQAFNN